jgi:hypothetical protein
MAKMYLEVPCHYITNVCVCKAKYEPDTLAILSSSVLGIFFFYFTNECQNWILGSDSSRSPSVIILKVLHIQSHCR